MRLHRLIKRMRFKNAKNELICPPLHNRSLNYPTEFKSIIKELYSFFPTIIIIKHNYNHSMALPCGRRNQTFSCCICETCLQAICTWIFIANKMVCSTNCFWCAVLVWHLVVIIGNLVTEHLVFHAVRCNHR